MMYGFMGKILIIDLAAKTFQEISKNESFYRNLFRGLLFMCKAF